MTSLLLFIVSIGIYLILRVSIIKGSFDVLLQEGDYNKKTKKNYKIVSKVNTIYWSLVTAIFFIWSFTTKDWKTTWIIWPIAGILFIPVTILAKTLSKDKDQ